MLLNNLTQNNLNKPEKIYDLGTNGNFLYIRHGETDYNVKIQKIPKEVAGVDPINLDLPLNEKGIEQSIELAENLKNFKIKYVLTSPLLRCLETAHHSLNSHPDKEKFKIIICPLLTETVHSTHDYSVNILKKKEIFSKKNLGIEYDWSLFEQMFPFLGDQEFYYLKFIDTIDKSDERNNLILEKLIKNIDDLNSISKLGNQEISEKYEKELMTKIHTDLGDLAYFYFRIYQKKPESLYHMFIRSLKFKELLLKLNEKFDSIKQNPEENIEKNKENIEKVLVYTHSAFIKISTSSSAYEMEELKYYPDDCAIVKNCGILSMNI